MTLTAHRQQGTFHVKLGPRDIGGQLIFLPLMTESSLDILTETSQQILVTESSAFLNTITAHRNFNIFHMQDIDSLSTVPLTAHRNLPTFHVVEVST